MLGPFHPLEAPMIAWQIFNDKTQAIKLWLRLLKPPVMGPWYRFPWCGWKQFIKARPWQ